MSEETVLTRPSIPKDVKTTNSVEETPSLLLSLPLEILVAIVGFFEKDTKMLESLRLTTRALSFVATEKLFSSIKTRYGCVASAKHLSSLTSTRLARFTKKFTIRIGSLVESDIPILNDVLEEFNVTTQVAASFTTYKESQKHNWDAWLGCLREFIEMSSVNDISLCLDFCTEDPSEDIDDHIKLDQISVVYLWHLFYQEVMLILLEKKGIVKFLLMETLEVETIIRDWVIDYHSVIHWPSWSTLKCLSLNTNTRIDGYENPRLFELILNTNQAITELRIMSWDEIEWPRSITCSKLTVLHLRLSDIVFHELRTMIRCSPMLEDLDLECLEIASGKKITEEMRAEDSRSRVIDGEHTYAQLADDIDMLEHLVKFHFHVQSDAHRVLWGYNIYDDYLFIKTKQKDVDKLKSLVHKIMDRRATLGLSHDPESCMSDSFIDKYFS